jgi:hypothetical protein
MCKEMMPPEGAEDRSVMLWFNITKVVSEQVTIGREDGLSHQLNLKGVVPDDIGMSRIAGKPVTLALSGFSEFFRVKGTEVVKCCALCRLTTSAPEVSVYRFRDSVSYLGKHQQLDK